MNDMEREKGRRCDYCGEHKSKTREENLGSIICSDCDSDGER